MISVIIPTYNSSSTIRRTLESVFNQTKFSLITQIIIIDNFSVDETLSICDGFAAEKGLDAVITIYRVENSGSVAVSRNFGAKMATGKWLAFLDSDDYWYPAKIELQVCCLNDYSGDFCSGMVLIESQRKNVCWQLKYVYEQKFLEKRLFREHGNLVVTSTVLIKKDVFDTLGGFVESSDWIGAEDFNLWYRLAERRELRSIIIPHIVASYSVSEGSLGHVSEATYLPALTQFVDKDYRLNGGYRWLWRRGILSSLRSRDVLQLSGMLFRYMRT